KHYPKEFIQETHEEPEQMYIQTMYEAAQFQIPSALRRLFAIILLFGEPNNVRALWNISFTAMSEDFAKHGIPNDNFSNELPRLILNELNIIISSEDLIKIELLNEQQ
ncbi:35154_t:CDS:2, partial [Gigaspora margarita]